MYYQYPIYFLKATLLTFPFLLIAGIVKGQNTITGNVKDTTLHLSLPEVSVTLLTARDSFIVADARTGKNGHFAIAPVKDGAYLLLFTYPGYVDFFQTVICRSDSMPVIDLGSVTLLTRQNLLEDVIVQSKSGKAITIRGDTTEYTADSFRVEKNANVEALLKQLPGIQIDQYGNIKGQGKAVHKVLVDGEEFFGSDPLLVTRNLRADMVDKVQLFDQKSDQAIFTGIDDGLKNKTINITLKQNKKNGAFGKIEADAGTHHIYGARAMANAFKGRQKAAVYFTVANNGITDLATSDQGAFGSIAGGSGHYEGEGIPRSVATGGHYNNSWHDKALTLNSDYKYSQLQVKNKTGNTDQHFLPDNKYIITRATGQSYDRKSLQLMNISSDIKIDSTSTLKVAANGQIQNAQNRLAAGSASYNNDQALLNNTESGNTQKTNSKYVNASAYWTKKFAKNKRTLSAMVNFVENNSTGHETQHATNNFFSAGVPNKPDSSQYIDLIKRSAYQVDQFSANITYTEPVTNYLSFIASYGHDGYKTSSFINSFNQLTAAGSDKIDSLYSNHFIYRQQADYLALDFSYSKKRTLFSFGSRFNQQKLNQVNLFNDSAITKSYLNLAPHAKLTLNLTPQKSMSFHYDGSTRLPNVSELQPVVDNSNPLFLIVGNTKLKPSFSNKLSYDYNVYHTQSDKYFNINLSYGITGNGITSNISTDTSTGKTIMSYLNAKYDPSTHLYGSSSYSFPIWKTKKLNLSLGGEVQDNKYVNFINGIQNKVHNSSYAFSLGLNKARTTDYDLMINSALGYVINSTSLQNTLNNNYLANNSSLVFNYYLPAHFQLHTDLNYVWRDKTNRYTSSFNRLIMNGWIGKKLLKNEQLLIKISANDLFNQNTGFSRNAYNNEITQHSFLTIGRNFGLSIVWDFKNFKNNK